MSYRILVEPQAAQRLRTFSSHVVPRLGRLLAELADVASAGQGSSLAGASSQGRAADPLRVEAEDLMLLYRVDKQDGTLTVIDVASSTDEQPEAQIR